MKLLRDLRKFAFRGNVLDLAFGFTVGAAFTTVARSLVDDVVMPPLGLLIGRADLADYYVLLRSGSEAPPPYATLAAAREAGAVTLNYGQFLTSVVTFVIVAVAVFVIFRLAVRAANALKDEFGRGDDDDDEPESKKCAYCRETVSFRATRCPHCTSQLGADAGPQRPDAALLLEADAAGTPGGRGTGG